MRGVAWTRLLAMVTVPLALLMTVSSPDGLSLKVCFYHCAFGCALNHLWTPCKKAQMHTRRNAEVDAPTLPSVASASLMIHVVVWDADIVYKNRHDKIEHPHGDRHDHKDVASVTPLQCSEMTCMGGSRNVCSQNFAGLLRAASEAGQRPPCCW